MRYLIDIVHPAHVHFFKYIISGLEARGHQTRVVARDREVIRDLLEQYGIPYTSVGRAGRKSRFLQFSELLGRDYALLKIARSFAADAIVTRNPAGVQAARLLRIPGVFDTDDGLAAGIHFKAAAPFADVITTPDCLPECYGKKHVKYPGYKQLSYLHPDHFIPDPEVLQQLGVNLGEKYFLLRFVAMTASHDKDEAGLCSGVKADIIERLKPHGRIFITSESELPGRWKQMGIRIPPHRIHDAMAFASMYIGDSQTMAAEAAVLGTPSIRASSFVGRISYLEEMEKRYGLTFGFRPAETSRILDKIDELLAMGDYRFNSEKAREKMLSEKCNVAEWFVNYLCSLPSNVRVPKSATT